MTEVCVYMHTIGRISEENLMYTTTTQNLVLFGNQMTSSLSMKMGALQNKSASSATDGRSSSTTPRTIDVNLVKQEIPARKVEHVPIIILQARKDKFHCIYSQDCSDMYPETDSPMEHMVQMHKCFLKTLRVHQ